jgi:hypothetical protein
VPRPVGDDADGAALDPREAVTTFGAQSTDGSSSESASTMPSMAGRTP